MALDQDADAAIAPQDAVERVYGRMTLAERSAKVSGCTTSFFCATGVKPSFW